MRKPSPWITLVLPLTVLGLTGCVKVDPAPKAVTASRVEAIDGSSVKRVVLNPGAEKRLDIQTTPIRPATPQEVAGLPPGAAPPPGVAARTAIPYEALIYDKKGGTFAYTNPTGLDYVREPVAVDNIRDKVVVLTAGPAVGTAVVSVGAVLLYGVETGVGK